METVCKALFCIAALLPAAVQAQSADEKRAMGRWQLVKGIVNGSPVPENLIHNLKLELSRGRYKVTGAESPDQGTWKADTTSKPHTLDITGTEGPNKGRTLRGIFEVNGDTLRVCYDLTGKVRPSKFESLKQTATFLAEYRRVKAGK